MNAARSSRRAGAGHFSLLPLALLLALAGCGLPGRPERIPSGAKAWEIPPAALDSQRLYRIGYQGPEGKLAFRLTLYLMAASHFRMDAADGVGRRIFSLELAPPPAVAGSALPAAPAALFLDHREKQYCRLAASGLPADLPLANLPLDALPRLLLGVMPAQPAVELAQDAAGKLSYLDAAGQKWSGQVGADGLLQWWTLAEGGEAVAWWQRQPSETIYSDRKAGLQVRLQEQVVERLASRPAPLEIPPGYAEIVCLRPPR